MKTIHLKISFVLLVLCFMGAGCEKEDDSDGNLIVKELPAFYIGYDLEPEETVVIKDQATFDNVFSKELVAQTSILQNIDFLKYTVLVGQSSTLSGFATLKHKFSKLENNSYVYQLDVSYELVGVPMNFCYGIIVNKLPLEANIKFEVNKD